MRTNELMLYKNMEYGEILKDITFLIDNYESEFYNKEDLRGLLFDCINELLELSVSHGFEGNLWHTYLTFLLASDENAYSTSCEIVGEIEGSLNEIALHDFAIFKEMFDYDFEELEKSLDADCLKIIMDYKSGNSGGKVFNRRVRDRICDLSRALAATQNVDHFKRTLTQFYKEFGVGKLGLHKAFRVEHPENSDVEIIPITNIAHAKQAPGSHVIVKTHGDELPDRTFEEAARLAAYYSSMRGSDKVEIDYVEKKQVKKPNGGKPGFVVYYTNYSMVIDSDISNIEELE